MTTSDAESSRHLRPSKIATTAMTVALIAVAAIVVGVLGATAGLLAPLLGFLLFAAAMVLGAVLSLLLGAVALVVTRARTGRPARPNRRSAWAAVAIGAVLLVLLLVLAGRARDVPSIHDITTDPNDPPAFQAAAEAPGNRGRDLTYPHGRGDVRALQRQAYPDLEPIRVPEPPAEALSRAMQAAEDLGWQVTEADEGDYRFEATSTSRLFRFVDDIAVRVRPDPSGGSVVDVRSTSRVGESDLGANAERIRAFRDRLIGDV